MQEIIILIGFPGAGKTTYCREKLPDYIRVSLYELTRMVGGNKKVAKKLELKCIEKALDMGFNVVIDRANLTGRRRKKIIDFARKKTVYINYMVFCEEHIRRKVTRGENRLNKNLPQVSELEIEDMKKRIKRTSLTEVLMTLVIVKGEE
jgi:predicted kinase